MKLKISILTFLYSLIIINFLDCQINSNEENLFDNPGIIEYAIYYSDTESIDIRAIKSLIISKYSDFQLLDTFPNEDEKLQGLNLILQEVDNVKSDFPPPDMESLQYFGRGMSDKQKLKMQKSKNVIVLDFYMETKNKATSLEKANILILDLLKNKDDIISDSETREYFTGEFWESSRLVKDNSINIVDHITIHFYRSNDFCRAITLGMSKFGLPDICIENLSCSSGVNIYSLVNLIAQTILEVDDRDLSNFKLDIDKLENQELKNSLSGSLEDNAEKKGVISFKKGTWEEGDPFNNLLEVSFDGSNPQIAHDELISKIFGATDEIVTVGHNDILLAASQRAKDKIPELKKLFLEESGAETQLLLKFPFDSAEGDKEWMWVEVVKWKGKNITGILQNDPYYVKNLKAGQKVSKNVKDMFDYLIYYSDGRQEGNETGEIISRNQN